ncbi:MAG: aldo/keto reductase [Alphaproteobacteria bacterium]|nr:aldo/keto reductase [Alphaproteobacteria bacterium]
MKYAKLGSSDLQVSRICLGTMTWGAQNTQDEGFQQMDYAREQGVNFFDTAELYAVPPTADTYGKTETIIGNWFESRGKREDVILATKVSPVPWARGEDNPVINKASIKAAVEGSLKRLKTDYIDLYQLHWPTNRPNYHFANWWNFEAPENASGREAIIESQLEILEALKEQIDAGKIREIGMSNDSAWGITQYVELAKKHNLPRMVSTQNEYNLLRRRDEHDVAEACALEEVGYLVYSPLDMGVLSGKYLDGKFPEGSRFSKAVLNGQEERFNTRMGLHAMDATRAYMEVAKKHGLDMCQMALAFTIRKNWLTSTIIGATTMEQLKSNIAAVDVVLTDECLKDIHTVYQKYPVGF